MKRVILARDSTGDEGTFGTLRLEDSHWASGELPWRDNQPDISCVPPGTYVAKWQLSPRHGWCYHLLGVPGRSGVEIHPANWMGDASKGYRCDLRGCVALGIAAGRLEGQNALLESRDAVAAFNEKADREDLEITILDIPAPALNSGFVGGVDE